MNERNGHSFVVYYGQVNEEDDGPVEVGLPTRDGDKTLPGGEVAFTVVQGEQCEFPAILGAYEAVARWVKENGRELAGPPREVNAFDANEPMRLEITYPLH